MKPRIIISIMLPLLVLLFLVSGLLFINVRLLPKSISSAARRLESRAGLTLMVNTAGYLPFRGLRLTGVHVDSPDDATGRPLFSAGRVRIDIDIFKYLGRGMNPADQLIRRISLFDVEINLEEALFLPKENRNIEGLAPDTSRPNADESASAPVVSESAEGVGSRDAAAIRRFSGFDRFWELGSEIIGHRLFPGLLTIKSLAVHYWSGGTPWELPGYLDMQFSQGDSPLQLFIETAGERIKISSTLNFAERRAEADVSLSGMSLEHLASLFEQADDSMTVSGAVGFDGSLISPVPGLVELEGTLQGRSFAVSHRTLGEVPVSGIDLEYDFNLLFDPEAPLPPPRILGKATPSNPAIIAAMQESQLRDPSSAWGELRFRRGNLRINGIDLEFLPAIRGIFPRPSVPARLDLRLHLPDTAADRILRAVPAGLSGPFEGMKLAGSISWDLDLEVPMDMIREMNWRSSVSMEDFAVASIPAELNVYKLKRSFTHILEDGRGFRKVRVPGPRRVGLQWMMENSELTEGQIYRLWNWHNQGAPEPDVPGGEEDSADVPADWSYRYVYLEDMSRWIPLAVLTCEDGDFFFHDGINWLTFRHAVERNISSGGIEVGASTLSMQLIKNLFLNRRRVLTRKIHEAFLVYLLEGDARVSKERILELYINLVEFGPGIIGIHEAAEHYFGKIPREINASEAVWLASILPAPRSYYRMYLDGTIPDSWWARMKGYFDLMLERGRFTEEEYRQARAERPRFAGGDTQ